MVRPLPPCSSEKPRAPRSSSDLSKVAQLGNEAQPPDSRVFHLHAVGAHGRCLLDHSCQHPLAQAAPQGGMLGRPGSLPLSSTLSDLASEGHQRDRVAATTRSSGYNVPPQYQKKRTEKKRVEDARNTSLGTSGVSPPWSWLPSPPTRVTGPPRT